MPKKPILSSAEERQLENVVHGWILHAISTSRKDYGKWVFHGGTALQRAYHSLRYSEDLDFMIEPNLNTDALMQHVQKYVSQMASMVWPSSNVRLKARTSDKNPRMFYLAVEIPDVTMSVVKVKVEFCETVSLAAYAKTSVMMNPQQAIVRNTVSASPAANVEVGQLEQIYIDKWVALTMRPEIKHRDVWDLSWLLEKQAVAQMLPKDIWSSMQSLVQQYYPNNDQTVNWLNAAEHRLARLQSPEYTPLFMQDMQRWLDPVFLSMDLSFYQERVQRVVQRLQGIAITMKSSYEQPQTPTC